MIISYKGIKPNASKAAFVAENAVVAGNPAKIIKRRFR